MESASMEPENSETFLEQEENSTDSFQFSCKSKICVFCAELIGSDSQNDELEFPNTGLSKETFLQGISVLSKLLPSELQKEVGKFADDNVWQLIGVDNFAEWVCCFQCYRLLEKVVSLHQLLLATQTNLKATVSKIQEFLVESQRKTDLEYSINACVQFREVLLSSIAPKAKPVTTTVHLDNKKSSARRHGPRSKTLVNFSEHSSPIDNQDLLESTLNPVVKLERLNLPVELDEFFVEVNPDLEELEHNGGDDDNDSYTEPAIISPPLSPEEPVKRKRILKEDEDYKPVPKRRRGTRRKRGRPRIHPRVKKVPRKRGRPPKAHMEEKVIEGTRRESNRTTKPDTNEAGNTEGMEVDEDAISVNSSENRDESDEEYRPDDNTEDNIEKEVKPISIPKRSRASNRRSLPNEEKRPRGRPAKPGSRRYRILNEEGPSHKPIYVLNRSEGLFMFFNVKFRRGLYSLQCLHPDCQHVEPLTGYFSDQVAYRNFRFHVRHHHRNTYKPAGDTSKNLYYCHHCHAQIESRDLLSEHRRQFHPNHTMPNVLCEVCGDIMSQYSIIRHTISHKNEDEKQVAMDVRRKRAGKVKDITKPLEFPCDECSKSFKCHTELRLHKVVHIPLDIRRQHICDICGSKFARPQTIEFHKRRVHFKDIPPAFECKICGRNFKRFEKDKYEIHVRAHTGEKPFQCEKCGKGFTNRYALSKHKMLHEETRGSITCEFCPNVYKNHIYLKRHQRKHHQDLMRNKPDPEKVIKYRKSQPQYNLIGPKLLYPCEPCGHQYQYKSMLITHLKGKHNMQFATKEDYPVMWTMEDQQEQVASFATQNDSYYD